MSLKDKTAAKKKIVIKEEVEEKKNGKYEHEDILKVFKKRFSKEDGIAIQYRLRLNPRGDERVRISMGGGHRDILEIFGNCIVIKERRAYHIFMQDKDLGKMFNFLQENKRLNGI